MHKVNYLYLDSEEPMEDHMEQTISLFDIILSDFKNVKESVTIEGKHFILNFPYCKISNIII